MRQCFHYQAWHMEPPIWRKETLKIEEKCFLLQIADHANTIERYGQFLRHVSHSGSLHLYYDGTGIVKILLFGACSRDVWAGADAANSREAFGEGARGFDSSSRTLHPHAVGDGDHVAVSPLSGARPVDGQTQRMWIIPVGNPRVCFAAIGGDEKEGSIYDTPRFKHSSG